MPNLVLIVAGRARMIRLPGAAHAGATGRPGRRPGGRQVAHHVNHPIIDCDVHVYPRDPDELRKYLPLPWKHWYRGESRPFYQSMPPLHGSRQDAFPPGGGRPGTDPG